MLFGGVGGVIYQDGCDGVVFKIVQHHFGGVNKMVDFGCVFIGEESCVEFPFMVYL